MLKLALLGLTAAYTAMAAPSLQARSVTCIDAQHWSNGGVSMAVPPNTECKVVNGVGDFYPVGGLVALQSGGPPAPPVQSQSGGASVPQPPPAQTSLPGAPAPVPQPSGTGSTVPPPPGGNVSGTTAITPGTLTNLVTKYQSALALGVSPAGVATCPAGPATINYPGSNSASNSNSSSTAKRYVAYWSAWHGTGHNVLPTAKQLKGVTHLVLAFWDPNTMSSFSVSGNTNWGIDIASQLKGIKSDMKVMVAVGGWALDEFFRFNATDTYRDNFSQALADFVYMYKLDGIDVDWEYPVDHGATYMSTRPKSDCDSKNNVLLMQSVRQKLDALIALPGNTIKKYYLSLAVPAIEGDMLAYDSTTAPEIDKVVDFWNLMTYDYTNRRSATAEHQAGGGVIKKVVAKYKSLGLSGQKLNMGFPMYAKWFSLAKASSTSCTAAQPIGCSFGAGTFEDPTTGADMGASGTVMFNNDLNSAKDMGVGPYTTTKDLNVYTSWGLVNTTGVNDATNQATAAYDATNKIWWSWVTGANVKAACQASLADVGGVMMWSIDQDNRGADGGDRFDAVQECLGV